MKHKVTVVVTKADIKQGMKDVTSWTECPIGLATNRALQRLDKDLVGRIGWGGGIEIHDKAGFVGVVEPEGLKDMPHDLSPAGIRYVKTPRRFHFFINL